MGSAMTLRGVAVAYDRNDAAELGRGMLVTRPTAALPQTATAAIFTVTGRCVVTLVVGEVTTAIQAQATTAKLQANPTAAGTSVDLCATLDINADVVGELYGITGTFANAMVSGLAIPAQATSFIVQAGTIDLVTGASSTGAIKWSLRFFPLDTDANIVAA